jgi:hypothetical protein
MSLHGLRRRSRVRGHAGQLPKLADHLRCEVIGGELLECRKKFRIDEGIWVRNLRRSF